jgi:undecaprenyl-diphosphatase
MTGAGSAVPGPEGEPHRNSDPEHDVVYILDLTFGIILGCIALGFFIWIAILATRGRVLPLDTLGVEWARSYHTPQEIATVLEITALGSLPALLLVLLIATAFFLTLRRGEQAVLLWIATVSGAILNLILKAAIARPRPPLTTPVHAGFFAFPSGHATSSMVVYATLAYLIVRDAPGTATRTLTILVAALVVLLIGLSRIYLGVHYATDVVGGYLIGFVWADLWVLLFEIRQERKGREE